MLESPELLAYWINERENIRYLKKEGLQGAPWSLDPVFQRTYFTNVHREDDRLTKWIREHWPHDDVGLVVLARMFNLPSHLQDLLHWRLDGWGSMIETSKRRRTQGEKLFNGAYLITTCGVKMDKVDYVYRVARDAASYDYDFEAGLQSAHEQLTEISGLGDFLAAQVVADLKNTQGHPLQNAHDWWTWCAPGPGSLRGIQCIEGYQGTSRGSFAHAATRLHASLGITEKMCMQDFQNCLCEFSKYVKVKNGGRSKRRYAGDS